MVNGAMLWRGSQGASGGAGAETENGCGGNRGCAGKGDCLPVFPVQRAWLAIGGRTGKGERTPAFRRLFFLLIIVVLTAAISLDIILYRNLSRPGALCPFAVLRFTLFCAPHCSALRMVSRGPGMCFCSFFILPIGGSL